MNNILKVFIVSITHWDREWYMSLQPSIYRFVKLMDRLLDILENEPGYHSFHLDGQFLPIKDYLEVRPEKKEIIARFVSGKKLIIGPWYAPPTETLVSGESMIRNLLLGMRESDKLGGSSDLCWIVDCLGHISQMPMICKGFGIEHYIACRGMPKGSKKVFKWRGSDGTEIFFHYLTAGYGNMQGLPEQLEDYVEVIDKTPFQRQGLVNRIAWGISVHADRRTTANEILLNGMDHASPQRNLPLIINKLNGLFPEAHFQHASLHDYIDAVCADHEKQHIPYDLHTGEMFDSKEFPVLEPINSVRTPLKIMNSEIEQLLERWMEPFAAYAHFCGAKYDTAHIGKAWEFVLQNHSHDTLGCSSVDPVYTHTVTRYEWARDVANEVISEALTLLCHAAASSMHLNENELAVAVFNPLSFARNSVITAILYIPEAIGIVKPAIYDGNQCLPMDIREKRKTMIRRAHPGRGFATFIPIDRYVIHLAANNVPANGYKMLVVRNEEYRPYHAISSMVKSLNTMENEFLCVTINQNGSFDLLDKESGRTYSKLNIFEDSSEVGSGFARQTVLREEIILSYGVNANIAVITDSPIKASFRVKFDLNLPVSALTDENGRDEKTTPVSIESIISIMRGCKRVDVTATINNTAKDHRLRVLFPTGIDARTVYAGQPFDVVARDITPKNPNDYPPAPYHFPWTTHPHNGFVDFNNEAYGLTVAARGLYEYELIDNADKPIALTLLRCLHKLEFGEHATYEEEYMELAQCIGSHTFSYSVIPHSGGYEHSFLEAEDFRTPLMLFTDHESEESVFSDYRDPLAEAELNDYHSFVSLSGEKVLISAVKKHEENNSLVIRVHNFGNEPTQAALSIDMPRFQPACAYAINLAEKRLYSMEMSGGGVNFEIAPHGLFTVEFAK